MWLSHPFEYLAGQLQEHMVVPLLYAGDLMRWEEFAFGWSLFAVYGAAQVVLAFAICVPLERYRPVERWPDQKAVLVDILYTLLSRVGLLPLVTFVLFSQVQIEVNGVLTDHGWIPPTLERLIPWLFGQQVITFILYAVILDFAEVPPAMMPAMFTCARTAGWSAHILEQKRLGKLVRPAAVYVGPAPRPADTVAGWDEISHTD
jgi:hypothetical protein